MSTPDKSSPDWHFMSYPDQSLLCHFFIDTTNLKHNLPGPDSGNPKLGFTFTLAHSGFQWFCTYRLMRKHPKIDFTFTMQKMSSSNSTGFDIPCRYPAPFEGLQAVFAKRHKITSGGITSHFAALAFTKLNSFGHHCHYLMSS